MSYTSILIFSLFIISLDGLHIFPNYYIVEREDYDMNVFGYDARHVAQVKRENDGDLYVSIRKVNGFSCSMFTKIAPGNENVLAFFIYNGKDYVWTKDRNSIMQSKISSPPNFEKIINIDFDNIAFDHHRGGGRSGAPEKT